MFGIWRMLLAVEVVAQHLLLLPFIGFYAVFSFFVLSGFLMTHIVHNSYGYTGRGFKNYLSNRALRLYPAYWVAILVSIALIAAIGAPAVAAYNPAMTLPKTSVEWVQNLSIIFANLFPKDVMPRLVPLAWALTVEITYYVAIGLGASRTRTTTFVWLLLGLGYVALVRIFRPEGGGYLYDAIPAGSLPFSVGALAWHFRAAVPSWLARLGVDNAILFIAGRWLLYIAIVGLQLVTGWRWPVMAGNWINIPVSAIIVCLLFQIRPAPRQARWDKAIGEFSYPTYLLHIQMGLVASLLVTGAPAVFALGLALTLALAALCVGYVDPAARRLRSGFESRSG